MNSPAPHITGAERLRWQLRSTYLMVDLIHRAQRQHLPPVAFTVGNHGATLVVRCNTRAEWTVWVTATGVDQIWPAREHDGYLHLHAVGDLPGRDGGTVHVGVIADVIDQDEPPTADPLSRAS